NLSDEQKVKLVAIKLKKNASIWWEHIIKQRSRDGKYKISVHEEFKDVVSEEFPPILPPMRDIQHCIDFVPGAVIPHKAAYRMNPEEHEELQRQVQDLLEKGSIRESLSPSIEMPLSMKKVKDCQGGWYHVTEGS
ncbi:hypothetical protein Tco_1010417, partial [Tanacetum coccineum]